MNELIQEIEEDIRRERVDKLWHSLGRVMVALSVVVIAITAGFEIYHHQKQAEAMEYTSSFLHGLDQLNVQDYKGAVDTFSAFNSNPASPYFGLFMLRKAQAQMGLSDMAGAKVSYETIEAHDPLFGKLADIIAPMVEGGPVDHQVPAPDEAFYYTRAEWMGWRLWDQGKKDEAIAQFLILYQDLSAPQTLHERMAQVLHHVAPEKLPKESAAPVAATATTAKGNTHE